MNLDFLSLSSLAKEDVQSTYGGNKILIPDHYQVVEQQEEKSGQSQFIFMGVSIVLIYLLLKDEFLGQPVVDKKTNVKWWDWFGYSQESSKDKFKKKKLSLQLPITRKPVDYKKIEKDNQEMSQDMAVKQSYLTEEEAYIRNQQRMQGEDFGQNDTGYQDFNWFGQKQSDFRDDLQRKLIEVAQDQFDYNPMKSKCKLNGEKIQFMNRLKNGNNMYNMYLPKLTRMQKALARRPVSGPIDTVNINLRGIPGQKSQFGNQF